MIFTFYTWIWLIFIKKLVPFCQSFFIIFLSYVSTAFSIPLLQSVLHAISRFTFLEISFIISSPIMPLNENSRVPQCIEGNVQNALASQQGLL